MPSTYSPPVSPVDTVLPQRPRAPAKRPTPPVESVGARMVNTMRIVLAFSALGVIYVAVSEPERQTTLTYASLIAYCAYSVIAYYFGTRGHTLAAMKTSADQNGATPLSREVQSTINGARA